MIIVEIDELVKSPVSVIDAVSCSHVYLFDETDSLTKALAYAVVEFNNNHPDGIVHFILAEHVTDVTVL